jgi:chromosome segregation ATPase
MDTPSAVAGSRAALAVRNIGGIDETTVELGAGVTVLEGRNASNRTSLLQAIMAGCGSDDVSLKADAESASVSLTLDGETYERTLTREGGAVVGAGEGPVADVESAELFAFLLESNEARRAVARGDDLRELIMRPIDTAAIRREIRETTEREVDDRLEELEELERARPDLERRHEELTADIEETEAELAEVEAAIDDASGAVGEERAEQEELEAKLEELRELRSQLDDVRYDRETERESLERLREERAELRDELEELPEPDDGELASVRQEMDDRRTERARLEEKLSELDTVVQFNREMLEGSRETVAEALADGDDGAVTDQLVGGDDAVRCWTCGSAVESDDIERTVDLLRELRERTADDRDEVQAELDRLDERVEALQTRQRRRREVRQRLDRIEEELEATESTMEALEAQRDSLEEEIETVEAAVEQRRDESRSELLDLHERANELERELGRLDNERDTVEAELEEIRAGIEERSELVAEREQLGERLVELRTRIERIQTDAIEAFNAEMETVLDLLDYRNVERVWLERTEPEDADDAAFHLHIVRNSEGAVYEDTIDNLSESEREVVGLVFALAGYLAHEVYEDCPFVLLDSLEAIDAQRIAALVEYFDSYSDYLVVALLPDDAAAVDDGHVRVTEI